PLAIVSSGTRVLGVTVAPAAIRLRAPTTALSSTMEPLPTNACSPIVQSWTMQECPIVAFRPISHTPSLTCTTVLSWMLAPSRTMMRPKSPRSTAPYHTEAFFSTTTSPINVAVGAIQASGCTVGLTPSKANIGMGDTLTSAGSTAQKEEVPSTAGGDLLREEPPGGLEPPTCSLRVSRSGRLS